MSFKQVLIFFFLFIFLNAGFFVLYKGNLLKPKQQSTLTNQPFSAQSASTINLPVNKDNKAVKTLTLAYGFEGKIIKADPAPGNEIYITLDTSDLQTPAFLTTPNTFINSQSAPGKKLTAKDLKAGNDVILTEVFDLSNNTWNLIGITIKSK